MMIDFAYIVCYIILAASVLGIIALFVFPLFKRSNHAIEDESENTENGFSAIVNMQTELEEYVAASLDYDQLICLLGLVLSLIKKNGLRTKHDLPQLLVDMFYSDEIKNLKSGSIIRENTVQGNIIDINQARIKKEKESEELIYGNTR